ncbi:MAG: hypothetical protein Q7S52_01900 [bacterium]|nr:hypothetical protein [bacterium]
MEYLPQRTLEYAPGLLDKYIGFAEEMASGENLLPAKIRITRERLPVYFDLAIENGEAVDDTRVAHIGDLINKLNIIDIDALEKKLRFPGRSG